MRTVSTAQEAVLSAPQYAVRSRVYVENSDGYYRSLSSLQGYDWVDDVEWDEDIDQPTAQLRVRLFRDVYQMSLAPLMEDSMLNLDAAASYAALLDLGRDIVVLTETAAIQSREGRNMPILMGEDTPNDYAENTPNDPEFSGLYELAFRGETDEIDWGGERITVVARDLGGKLMDTFIEDENSYGSAAGTAVEGEMQDILDDNDTGVNMSVPASPSWAITSWVQRKEPVLEALRRLAFQIGWDVRYKWRASPPGYALTLYEPDRTKVTPDRTLSASQYYDVTRLAMNRAGIRNVVRVIYTDADEGRKAVERSNATSINKYGRRFMEIVEVASWQIDTSTEATAMADGALYDLKEPKMDQEVVMPYFFPVELGDLYRFSANGLHYSTAQDLAVIGFRHHLSRDEQRTTLIVRGSPAGAYKQWLVREARPGVGRPAPFSDESGGAYQWPGGFTVHDDDSGTVTMSPDGLRFTNPDGTGGYYFRGAAVGTASDGESVSYSFLMAPKIALMPVRLKTFDVTSGAIDDTSTAIVKRQETFQGSGAINVTLAHTPVFGAVYIIDGNSNAVGDWTLDNVSGVLKSAATKTWPITVTYYQILAQAVTVEAQNVTEDGFNVVCQLRKLETSSGDLTTGSLPDQLDEGESWTSPASDPTNSATTEIGVKLTLDLNFWWGDFVGACTFTINYRVSTSNDGSTWTDHDYTFTKTKGAEWWSGSAHWTFAKEHSYAVSADNWQIKVAMISYSKSNAGFGWNDLPFTRVDSWNHTSAIVLATGDVQYIALEGGQ